MDTPGVQLTENTQALAGAVDTNEQLGGPKVSRSREGRQLLMARGIHGTLCLYVLYVATCDFGADHDFKYEVV